MASADIGIGIDLFAGVGGMSLGFKDAGFRVACAVEIDSTHAETHRLNFPETQVINKDIRLVSGADIRRVSSIGHQEIDVVFGGSPCQGFSTGGVRNPRDIRNTLVFDFVRLVNELQPRYFVFENVKGITIGYGKQVLEQMIEAFDNFGYSVLPYQILNAKNYGIPQNRERLILLGYREDCVAPKYPQPNSKEQLITVWDAIGDLPEASDFPELYDYDNIWCDAYGTPSDYASRLRILGSCKLLNSRLTLHSEEMIARFIKVRHGRRDPGSRSHKLNPDGVSPALRAGTGKDKGNHTAVRPIHPLVPRVITVREAARIHSFPDNFVFYPSKMWGMRQIGNSVPPLLAQRIAELIPR